MEAPTYGRSEKLPARFIKVIHCPLNYCTWAREKVYQWYALKHQMIFNALKLWKCILSLLKMKSAGFMLNSLHSRDVKQNCGNRKLSQEFKRKGEYKYLLRVVLAGARAGWGMWVCAPSCPDLCSSDFCIACQAPLSMEFSRQE